MVYKILKRNARSRDLSVKRFKITLKNVKGFIYSILKLEFNK